MSEIMTEADYYLSWRTHTRSAQSPFDFAVKGGEAADALPWVFVAGYQAAIRAVFTRNSFTSWVAFAVSEDRSKHCLLYTSDAADDL